MATSLLTDTRPTQQRVRPESPDTYRRCLGALTSVITVLDDLPTVAAMGPEVLRALGENLGWDVGVMSIVDPDSGEVLCNAAWFRSETKDGSAEWTSAPEPGGQSTRAALAARCGMTETVAFPILENGAMGLIELFRRPTEMSSREERRLVASAGALVGQFLARNRSQLEVREAQRELEKRVRERTSELLQANQALSHEIAERKRAQNQLLQADRMVSIGILAAGVAHEINNPLAYITANLRYGMDELRLKAGDLTEDGGTEVSVALQEAEQGADRVRRIVRDLKLFSRVAEDAPEIFDIRRCLESSLNMAASEIRHRAQLEKSFDEVPLVAADESRLGQVFLNLLINAAQAIPPAQVHANLVRVATYTDAKGRAVVEVRDSGSGIPPENLARIFDPFFTTKPLGVGTGLGLSICHGIVSSLGGEIDVESEVGKGTVFRVCLPPAQPR